MSERIMKRFGVSLLALSLILCFPAVITDKHSHENHYSSGNGLKWTVKDIITENNGPALINLYDAEEMTELPGIGETIASLVVSEREKNGVFHYPEDLLAVKGIGQKTLEKIRCMIDFTTFESGDKDGLSRSVP